jgi:hypothetical protein
VKRLPSAKKRLNAAYVLKESFGQLWGYERESWARRLFENWRADLSLRSRRVAAAPGAGARRLDATRFAALGPVAERDATTSRFMPALVTFLYRAVIHIRISVSGESQSGERCSDESDLAHFLLLDPQTQYAHFDGV